MFQVASAPDVQAFEHMFRLATSYVVPAALYAVTQLNVADRIGGSPKPVSELARETGTNEDALCRVLRLLSAHGVFEEVRPRTFALTPAGELLRADHPQSLRAAVVFTTDPFHFRVYGDLLYSLRTGRPAVEDVYGKPCFEQIASDPELQDRFNAAMTSYSATISQAVLEAYDFSRVHTLVDVAGGHGMLLASILQKYPSIRGVLFDLPHVIDGARGHLARFGLDGRCRFSAGDFFAAIPEGADTYLMQHILHDWEDEKALAILRNIRRAINRDGRLLVIESVVGAGPASAFVNFKDIEMLLLPGGRERTEAEFAGLFSAAGFRLTRVMPTKSPMHVIEAVCS